MLSSRNPFHNVVTGCVLQPLVSAISRPFHKHRLYFYQNPPWCRLAGTFHRVNLVLLFAFSAKTEKKIDVNHCLLVSLIAQTHGEIAAARSGVSPQRESSTPSFPFVFSIFICISCSIYVWVYGIACKIYSTG